MNIWLVTTFILTALFFNAPANARNAAAIPSTQTDGPFVCQPGPAPAGAASSAETWVIDNSQTGITYVDTQPNTRSKDPSRVKTYCKVANTWCTGTSCNNNPEFDFINGGSLHWYRTGNYNSIRFVMIGHNTDHKTDYHMTLYIMPDWPVRLTASGKRQSKRHL